MPALELSGLSKRYGARLAVKDLDLRVERGEAFALLGPNGAGKSTTIHMLCGLLRPTAGSIRVAGRRFPGRGEARVGYCPQQNIFYDELTVLENLRFAGALFRVPYGLRKWRARRLAHDLGLAEHGRKRAGRLSGGMQRRLTLGLAMMHDPDLLVVEEPEAGLDPHSRQVVRQVLADVADDKTVLFSSHDMGEVERLADRVGILDDGILMAVGTPSELADKVGPGTWVDLAKPDRGPAPTSLEDIFLALTGGPRGASA